MRLKYKLLFFVPWVAVSGCDNTYEAVVQSVHENIIYVKDAETGDDKSIVVQNAKIQDIENILCLCKNDTITVLSPYGRDLYNNKPVINTYGTKLRCNMDSINARKERKAEEFLLRNR